MNTKLFKISFVFLSFVSVLQAQQLVPISKSEVLNKVSENNQSLKISNEDFKSARADYRQTNAIFLPNISFFT